MNIIIIYNILNLTYKSHRTNRYLTILSCFLFPHLYHNFPWKMNIISVHDQSSKEHYNKDTEIKTIQNSFDIELFYNSNMKD